MAEPAPAVEPGPEFNRLVWEFVRQVPAGKVVTYGRIAEMLAGQVPVDPARYREYGARWVGSAMAACPADVPWQRVVNAQGGLSPRRGGGEFLQRQLLEQEGVEFDAKGRIDLKRFGWQTAEPGQLALW